MHNGSISFKDFPAECAVEGALHILSSPCLDVACCPGWLQQGNGRDLSGIREREMHA